MGKRPKDLRSPVHGDSGECQITNPKEVDGVASSGKSIFLSLTYWKHDTCAAAVVCVLLLLAVLLVFGRTVHYEFIGFDDNLYVYENPQVTRGLTARGIAWAFTAAGYAHNWHPLTWLTHMLDVQIYGLHPGGHHLTNVLLHAASVILLFVLLWRMTGFLWRSAFVAAVFALHPLRVESVAWVSERKDVLSGLFFMLTIWAYMGYVRRPFSWARYLTVMGLFTLGLMSKPMLVTLPFVLLLLDYWPLGRMKSWTDVDPAPVKVMDSRFRRNDGEESGDETLMGTDFKSVPMNTVNMNSSSRQKPGRKGFITVGNLWIHGFLCKNRRMIVEKIPLLVLASLSCVMTILSQTEIVIPVDFIPVPTRIANAAVSYLAYIGKLFYPVGLAVFYPHPEGGLSIWRIVFSAVTLTGISAVAVVWRRRFPYLFVGWFWYVGMLVPVIGLVQVSLQSMADRYTYLPQIGLVLSITWGIAQITASWRHRRWACGIASALAVLVLMGFAWRQVSYWRNNETLWTHALECTEGNYFVHDSLGSELAKRGQIDAAMTHFLKALEIRPHSAGSHYNLAILLKGCGEIDAAIFHYRKALEINPDYEEAHNNLGNALAEIGLIDEAMVHFRKALESKPEDAEVHNNLGIVLAQRGQIDEAIVHFRKALEIKPDNTEIRFNLDMALRQRRPSS